MRELLPREVLEIYAKGVEMPIWSSRGAAIRASSSHAAGSQTDWSKSTTNDLRRGALASIRQFRRGQ